MHKARARESVMSEGCRTVKTVFEEDSERAQGILRGCRIKRLTPLRRHISSDYDYDFGYDCDFGYDFTYDYNFTMTVTLRDAFPCMYIYGMGFACTTSPTQPSDEPGGGVPANLIIKALCFDEVQTLNLV